MPLIKWSPFFFEPFDSMDKVFDDMQSAMTTRSGGNIIPPVDMYETAEAVVVETPMPGVNPDELEIAIDNGVLTIKGTSERKTEVDDKNYYRKEVRTGSIFRQVALPARVQEGEAQASFENGILKILLPKAEARKAIKVEVKKK
jgi:Molecular chaperone (small heat shock protein)